jgi:hypothetical protein
MDEQERGQLFYKYLHILKRIHPMPITEEPSTDDLGVGRKDIQAAYRDVKKYNLDCSLMDFFGWVAALNVQDIFNLEESRNALRLFNFNKRLFCSVFTDYKFLKKVNEFCFDVSYKEITNGK